MAAERLISSINILVIEEPKRKCAEIIEVDIKRREYFSLCISLDSYGDIGAHGCSHFNLSSSPSNIASDVVEFWWEAEYIFSESIGYFPSGDSLFGIKNLADISFVENIYIEYLISLYKSSYISAEVMGRRASAFMYNAPDILFNFPDSGFRHSSSELLGILSSVVQMDDLDPYDPRSALEKKYFCRELVSHCKNTAISTRSEYGWTNND